MAASTTTQAAWTEDQLTVLEAARDNPDATPTEVAELIDDQHITSEYVTSILDGFHLPDDHDKPESEAARRLEGRNGQEEVVLDEEDIEELGGIAFRCAICGDEFSSARQVKSHIGKSGGAHADRSANDEPHLVQPVGDTENILRRLNDRPDAGGVVTDEHFRLLWTILRNPEATMTELGEMLDMGHTTVRTRLKDVGITGGKGMRPPERAEQVRELLAEQGLGFALDEESDDTDDTDDDTVTISPDDGYEGVLESFDSAEDVPVVKLDIGDTKDNTEVGGWYEGFVNNVEHYGAFVTLAKSGSGSSRQDLSGLAHKSNIPSMYVPQDYERGDEVVVERLPDEDNGNLTLRLVTDPDGEFIVDGPLVPPQASSEAGDADEGDGPDTDADAPTGRVRAESGNATYDGPAEGLDMTTQSIGERPVKGPSASEEEGDGPSGLDVLFPEADDEELADLRGELQSLNAALRGKGGAYQNLLNRVERLQSLLDPSEGEERAEEFVRLGQRLDAIEAAVTAKDTRDPDAEFTLHLTREEMKDLVREAPEDVADKALDALAGSP